MFESTSHPVKKSPLGWHCGDLFKVKVSSRSLFGRPTGLSIETEGQEWELATVKHPASLKVTLIRSQSESITILTKVGEESSNSILLRGESLYILEKEIFTLQGEKAVSITDAWKDSEIEGGIQYHVTIHPAGSALVAAVGFLSRMGLISEL